MIFWEWTHLFWHILSHYRHFWRCFFLVTTLNYKFWCKTLQKVGIYHIWKIIFSPGRQQCIHFFFGNTGWPWLKGNIVEYRVWTRHRWQNGPSYNWNIYTYHTQIDCFLIHVRPFINFHFSNSNPQKSFSLLLRKRTLTQLIKWKLEF